MKNTGLIVAIVAILLIAGGVLALTRNSRNKTTPASTTTNTNTESNTQTTQDTANPTNTDQNSEATISYDDNGFTPTTMTVKAGSQVTIKNDSSRLLQFDSDPHPEHTDDPELNVGTISPGQSKTITVTTTGSHGYHNHLNTSHTGTLVVE